MAKAEINELSERELEILLLVATGAGNKEIAHKLFISTNTVKVHLRNIFNKIGAASRTEAAMYAVRTGLVEAIPGQKIIEEGITPHSTPEASIVETGEKTLPDIDKTIPSPQPGTWFHRWRGILWIVLILGVIASGFIVLPGLRTPIEPTTAPATAAPTPTAIPRWKEQAALLTARSKQAVAAYDNKVYVIGGETANGVFGEVECYNPLSDTWTSLSPKPIPVADIQAAVIGGEIYIPGGRLPSGQPSNVLEVYDPRADRWEQRENLPAAISAYAMVAFEGRLYLFGGWDGHDYLNTVFEYDPAQDAWLVRSPMPTGRAFGGAAVAGGLIYVIGGTDGQAPLAVSEVYLPARDDGVDSPWDIAKPLPEGRFAFGISSVADLIYIIGGRGSEQAALPLLEYSPSTGTWQAFTSPIPEIWESLGTVTLGPNLYLLGGLVMGTPTSLNLSYQAIYTVVIPIVR